MSSLVVVYIGVDELGPTVLAENFPAAVEIAVKLAADQNHEITEEENLAMYDCGQLELPNGDRIAIGELE